MSTKNLTPVLETLAHILVLSVLLCSDGYQVWSESTKGSQFSDKLGWFYLLLVTSIVLLLWLFPGQSRWANQTGEPTRCLNTYYLLDCHDISLLDGDRPCSTRCRRALIPLCHFNGTSYPGSQEAQPMLLRYTFFHQHPCLGTYALIALALCLLWFPKREISLSSYLKAL